MKYSNENSRQRYPTLNVPAHFDPAGSSQDQVVFALAQIGAGSAEEVIRELTKHQSSVDPVPYLKVLFDKGLILGTKAQGTMRYGLAKITRTGNDSL